MATIMIIDDEQDICDIVQEVFEGEEGYAFLKADNGPDGVALVKKHHPDVIFLDLKLQFGMDGPEVLRVIRAHDPSAKVVVITGFVDEAMERDIRELGIDGYIEKPFTPPQLLEAVEKILEKKWNADRG